MKKVAALVLALGLSGAGTAALADTPIAESNDALTSTQPVAMTDEQLDNVTAGILNAGLINIDVNNVLNNNNVNVSVPVTVRQVNVSVAAAVAVLGTAGAVACGAAGC